MSGGSDYQRLRAHLAFLRMTAAAEALPALLDEATGAKLSHSAFLERLLAIEVDATDARRRASLARFASLPSPFTLADYDFAAQPSVDPKLIAELATLAVSNSGHLTFNPSRCSSSPASLRAAPPTRVTTLPRSPSDSVEGRPVVRTIGHGTRTSDELASLLSAAGVVTLIDVRRYPTGRRQPHLSRERLAADLPERGVAYEWWGEALGGRRSAMGSAVASGWRSPAFAAYSAHMSAPEFRGALAELEERASAGEALAIMCAETVWWRCHRRLIADALTLDGCAVEHLIDRVRWMRACEPSA